MNKEEFNKTAQKIIALEKAMRGRDMKDEIVQNGMAEMDKIMDSLSPQDLIKLAVLLEAMFCENKKDN